MGILISVVIPAYNEEKYISECIDSVIHQTYRNIEIIIIDDGSTDSTPSICDKYAKLDNRITVVHKKNAGLVAARKDGVYRANGDFLAFVDADDWIDDNCLSVLMEKQIEFDSDLVASSFFKQFGNEKIVENNIVDTGFYDKQGLENNIYPCMLASEDFFSTGIKGTLCGKIFRTKILVELYRDMPNSIRNGEDVAIVYPYLLSINSAYVMNTAFYHYRQLVETMSQRKSNQSDEISNQLLFDRLRRMVSKYNGNYSLKRQVCWFWAQFLLQHEIDKFDINNEFLVCFGRGLKCKKIAVYGAGRFGKQVYYYLNECCEDLIWVDKKSEYYKSQKLPVFSIDKLLTSDIDTIIISVIDERLSRKIRESLAAMGVSSDIIHCLDIAYITSEQTLAQMGYSF